MNKILLAVGILMLIVPVFQPFSIGQVVTSQGYSDIINRTVSGRCDLPMNYQLAVYGVPADKNVVDARVLISNPSGSVPYAGSVSYAEMPYTNIIDSRNDGIYRRTIGFNPDFGTGQVQMCTFQYEISFVVSTPVQCPVVTLQVCPYGNVIDSNGCQTGTCKLNPSNTTSNTTANSTVPVPKSKIVYGGYAQAVGIALVIGSFIV